MQPHRPHALDRFRWGAGDRALFRGVRSHAHRAPGSASSDPTAAAPRGSPSRGGCRHARLRLNPSPSHTSKVLDTLLMPPDSAAPIAVTLPDGSVRKFPGPVSGAELAKAIGPGLAKAALALKVDGAEKDLAAVIDRDAKVAIVTRTSPEALELLRHDAAHVMAEAAKELFPDVQVTFGPATETGFYYDFARDHPFTPEDLAKLEQRMHEIVDRDEAITREVWSRDDAVQFFQAIGEKYKAEWIQQIPTDEEISIYRQGKFVDL